MKQHLLTYIKLLIISFIFTLPLNTFSDDSDIISNEELLKMSLTELMNLKVVTASNVCEKKSEAPANIIVLSKNDIKRRGYSDLSQIFEDLPGMDVVRVNNDISFKNYMRGFRNTFGTPYLLLLDGLPWTDLYYHDSETIRAWPVSNVERVEVVYGPASTVYGANAFTGVVNVITKQENEENGVSLNGNVSGGNKDRRSADLHVLYQSEGLRLSLAARMENSDDFPEHNNDYEWSKSKYYLDKKLWGGFVESNAAGGLQSLNRHRAWDARLFTGDFEFGFQSYELTSGYSTEYAADHVLSNVVWTKRDYSIYGRYNKQINDKISSSTVLRYFASDVPNNSALAQGYNQVNENGDTVRLINYEFWETLSSSYSLIQNFQYLPLDELILSAGFQYIQKDNQREYEIASGPFLEPDSVDANSYEFPRPPSTVYKYDNRVITEETGIFLNAKYNLTQNVILHGGIRLDDHSIYGSTPTFRAGIIHEYDNFNFKFLYGEGYQAPSPRVLWGGWIGLGSDPGLQPEESKTFELSGSYTAGNYLQNLSAYYVNYKNTILNFSEGGRNVGNRKVLGIDYHFQFNLQCMDFCVLNFWGYYSYIHTKGDEIFVSDSIGYEEGEIGDIAPHKAFLGLTTDWDKHFSTTILGRYISSRNTVSTNPVGSIDGYFLVDLNLRFSKFIDDSFSIALKIQNLFDTHYSHPGIRTADAGITPGQFNENGVWQGSSGWLSSVLPQPGLRWILSLEYDL